MRFQLVIFDVDGTLLDPSEGVIRSVQYTVKTMGWKEIPTRTINSFIGPPIRESLKNHYQLSDDLADLATEIFRNRYKDEDMYHSRLYDGIVDFLETLKNRNTIMAVATYKRHDYAVKLLEYFKLAKYFTCIHGSDNYDKKTKVDIVNCCICDVNIKPTSDVVLVGDTEFDAVGAQEAGIKFIGVSYGFGFRSEEDVSNYQYVGFAKDLNQLMQLLL